MLDIFNSSAFSLVEMTDRVNRIPFVPMRVSQLGIFDEKGVRTTSIALGEETGLLSLIPNTPRGGPGYENARNRRKLRDFRIPHLELYDSVNAAEIQNVRSFMPDGNGQDQLLGIQEEVDRRTAEMLPKHDATVEYGRVGALKGVILDADGSTVLYNLFTEFGITQHSVDLDLGNTTADIIGKLAVASGYMEDELGGVSLGTRRILMGTTLWARFISHPNVKVAYTYFQENGQNMNPLREDLRYAGFMFGGFIIEQYRGTVGGVPFIPAAEGYGFPTDIPGLYSTYYAPADLPETVNTVGLPRYSYQTPNPDNPRKGIRIFTQSNPLSLCKRPGVLVKFTTGS